MARKTKVVTITAAGRDTAKRFLLTEMSSAAAEAWAFRAFGAMARAGIDVPEHVVTAGFVGMAAMGLKAFLAADYADIGPLLDEMMACVQVLPSPDNDAVVRPVMVEDDIEEVATRIRLRDEVFELHSGFSVAGSLLNAVGLAMKILVDRGANTETLIPESQPSSQVDTPVS